ncbi:MAG TPA: NADH-quinone oxidoreductase subunit J [Chthonomonadaceae bacterium]|nr:NADH-quinone oxidoreductase subunit J [Chthonomonadaceae bacterium]
MTPKLIVFAILAFVSVVSAVWMISTRNPVRSALFLVVTFLTMAVFYLTLGAQFIAAVQVIVYAGAIMVLFLFVIMLLNLGAPQALREPGGLQRPAAILLGAVFLGALFLSPTLLSMTSKPLAPDDYPQTAAAATMQGPPSPTAANIGTVETIGYNLFSPSLPWLFPFEATSVLLLVAVVGAIIMAKRQV